MSGLLQSTRRVIHRFLALAPLFVALATLMVVLLNVVNVHLADALRAAVVGWVFATPVAAVIAWTILELRPPELPGPFDPIPAAVERENASRTRRATRDGPTDAAGPDEDDPVAVLRQRFARGEITQDEFEERLDRLLATEDATAGTGRSAAPTRDEPTADRERSAERTDRADREREPEST